MKYIFSVVILALSFACQAQEVATSITPLVIGETLTFHSEILQEERKLNIYLPQNYGADSTKSYPVIYVLDGSLDEDFIHIAGLVQFCSFSWINTLPETIVVGIANVDRQRDFTYPTRHEQDQKDFPTSGKSAAFIDFIAEEVQPQINSQYRTTDSQMLIGQSLGGLLAAEILAKRPELFDQYVIVSPSLWWDDQSLLKQYNSKITSVKSIYIAVGKEGEIMERDAKSLYDTVMEQAGPQLQTHFKFYETKTHGDVLHQAVYDAFLTFKAETTND